MINASKLKSSICCAELWRQLLQQWEYRHSISTLKLSDYGWTQDQWIQQDRIWEVTYRWDIHSAMGCLTCAKVAEMPTKKVAMAHKTAPSAITWALLWLTAAYAANGAQSACIRERTRVSDPNFAGEACNSKPISLYTPGSNASSALSMIAARLTITSVRSASSLHHLKPHILVFWVFQ